MIRCCLTMQILHALFNATKGPVPPRMPPEPNQPPANFLKVPTTSSGDQCHQPTSTRSSMRAHTAKAKRTLVVPSEWVSLKMMVSCDLLDTNKTKRGRPTVWLPFFWSSGRISGVDRGALCCRSPAKSKVLTPPYSGCPLSSPTKVNGTLGGGKEKPIPCWVVKHPGGAGLKPAISARTSPAPPSSQWHPPTMNLIGGGSLW